MKIGEFSNRMCIYRIIFTFLPLLSLAIADALNNQNDTEKINYGTIIRKVQRTLLTDFMDMSAKPCDNFVQYSCGRWNVSEYANTEPFTEAINATITNGYIDNVEKMVTFLFDDQELFKSYSNDHPAIKAQDYYKSCLDVETTIPGQFETITNFTSSLLNITNFEEDIEKKADDWVKILADLRPYVDGMPFRAPIFRDIHNVSKYTLYFFKPEKFSKPLDMITITSLLKLKTTDLKANNTISKIYQFEKDLNDILNTTAIYESSLDSMFISLTIDTLNNELANLNLQRYISIILGKEINSISGEIYGDLGYLKKLNDLVSKTSKEIIIYYSILKLYTFASEYTQLHSDKKSDERREQCLNFFIYYMDKAFANLFNKKYLKSEQLNDLRKIKHSIKKTSEEILNQTSWIDNETRAKAIKKIQKITFDIGFPEFVNNGSKLKEFYKGVNFDKNNFFETTMSLHKLKEQQKLKLFGQLDREESIADYVVFESKYLRLLNRVNVAAGQLQLPLYNLDYPQYMKYGLIGALYGHEMFHALDNTGIHYDMNGDQNNWWTNTSLKQFNERSNCFIKQYNDLGSKGRIQLDENIADNVGLKVTYSAYVNWLNENKNNPKLLEEETISGLNLTSNQLFFVGYAQKNCAKYFQQNKGDNSHAGSEIRLIGILSNSKHFADAFNCNVGDNLNPQNKCDLW